MSKKCTGKYCGDAIVKREKGKGSFRGYKLMICSHCGQVVSMEKGKES